MNQKPTKAMWGHIAIITVIIVVFLVATIKLLIWNKGNDISIFEDENPSDELFVQNEDYLTYMSPDLLAGIEDDGINTIVFLGDDTLANYQGEDGIPALLEKLLPDCQTYNCAFPGMQMAMKNSMYTPEYSDDAFSLYPIAQCIYYNDYSLMSNVVTEKDAVFAETLTTLKGIDFHQTDTLVIAYGMHDYLNGHLITSTVDLNDVTSFSGALQSSLRLLKEAYPHLRIIILSPTFCMVETPTGEFTGCDLTNTGYGMLADYMVAEKNIAVMNNVSFLDNYYGTGINIDTYQDYLEKDWQHPNAKGRQIIAERIAKVLQP